MALRTACCFLVVMLITVFRVQAQERPVTIGDSILLGAMVTQPQIVSVSLTSVSKAGDPNGYDKFLHVEPGLAGGKIGIGIGATDRNHHRKQSLLNSTDQELTRHNQRVSLIPA